MRKIALRRARDDACGLLRDMIIAGELPAKTHVEEIKISTQIGLSRTPVREALIALEREGLVRSFPRKGFVVISPDEHLVRESFPILSALEALAVKISGRALRDSAPRLRDVNNALGRERTKRRQYERDRAFHVGLTQHCGNERLLVLIEMERARVQLFDGAHARGLADLARSCADHDAIVDAIAEGDFRAAADALSRHWDHGVEVVARWLQDGG